MSINSMTLFITEDCNLRCPYCFVGQKRPRHMTEKVALDSIDFLIKNSGNSKSLGVTFFGGEPMTKWDLMKKVIVYGEEEARKVGKTMRFSTTTNGTILPNDFLKFYFEDRDNCTILLSADGDEEIQNKNRPTRTGGESFPMLMKTIGELLKIDKWKNRGTQLRLTYDKNSYHRLSESAIYFYEMGVSSIAGMGVEEDSAEDINFDVFREQLEIIADYYINRFREDSPIYFKLFDDNIQRIISPVTRKKERELVKCGFGLNSIAVDVVGDIYTCHRLLSYNRFSGEMKVGNIYKDDAMSELATLSKRLDSMTAEDIRSSKEGKCDSCPIKLACGGGCIAVNLEVNDELLIRPEISCEYSIVAYEVAKRIDSTLGPSGEKNKAYINRFYRRGDNGGNDLRTIKQSLFTLHSKTDSSHMRIEEALRKIHNLESKITEMTELMASLIEMMIPDSEIESE